MKNMHKITNIALIYMLIGIFLCEDLHALRIPMNGYKKVNEALRDKEQKTRIEVFDDIETMMQKIEHLGETGHKDIIVFPWYAAFFAGGKKEISVFLTNIRKYGTAFTPNLKHSASILSMIKKKDDDIYAILMGETNSLKHPEPLDGFSYAYHNCPLDSAIDIATEGLFQIPWRTTFFAVPTDLVSTGNFAHLDVQIVFKIKNRFLVRNLTPHPKYELALDFTEELKDELPQKLLKKLIRKIRMSDKNVLQEESVLDSRGGMLIMANEFGLLLHIRPETIDTERTLALILEKERTGTFNNDPEKLKKLALLKRLLTSRKTKKQAMPPRDIRTHM